MIESDQKVSSFIKISNLQFRFYRNGIDSSDLKSRYLSSYKRRKTFDVLIQKYAENFKSKLIESLPHDSEVDELHTDYIKHALGFLINESFYCRSLKLSKKEVDKEIINFWKLP